MRMYLLDNKHHNLPHIHARYAEFKASINICDGEVLAGPLRQNSCRCAKKAKQLETVSHAVPAMRAGPSV